MKNLSILYLYGDCFSEITDVKLDDCDQTIRRIVFPQGGEKSMDELIHDELEKHLNKTYDLIITELNYNEHDFLDFTGLRVALHIRLTEHFNNQRTPIMVLGFLSFEELVRIETLNNSSLGSIIGTPGLYLSQDILLEDQLPLKRLSDKDFEAVIKKIKIDPPPNYESSHSIENESAIYYWSKAIGLENSQLNNNLEKRLFFKYQNQSRFKKELEVFNKSLGLSTSRGNERVLLIDDEAVKGWGEFYKKLLGAQTLIQPSINYKALNQDQIVNQVVQEVLNSDPHVLLIDLRLCESDVEKTVGLTGVRIIQHIEKHKEINKGIRIVITSASNKVWNYLEAGIRNSDMLEGVIVKSTEQIFNSHPIDSILKTIRRAVRNAVYLKDVFLKYAEIGANLETAIGKGEELDYLTSQLKFSFSLLTKSRIQRKQINFSYLILFQVLEGFIESPEFIRRDSNNMFIINEADEIIVQKECKPAKGRERAVVVRYMMNLKTEEVNAQRYINTQFKVAMLLLFRLGESPEYVQSEWIEINNTRNKMIAHGALSEKPLLKESEFDRLVHIVKIVSDHTKQDKVNWQKASNLECNAPKHSKKKKKGYKKQTSKRGKSIGSSTNTLGDFFPKKD